MQSKNTVQTCKILYLLVEQWNDVAQWSGLKLRKLNHGSSITRRINVTNKL